MFWADRIAKEIIDSGSYKPYWVDDMKTPSGFAHTGSLRGPLIHSIVYRALKDAGKEVKFTFVFNDFDPVDELSSELNSNYSKYLGYPLMIAPSPSKQFSSLADYYASDLKKVMTDLGVESEFLSSWKMYHQGKFNEVIRIALDNSEKIQDIYQKVSGSKKKEKGWLPFQVICEKCSRIGTTRVFAWDGKAVSYKCEENMVSWAKGCGHQGKISPFDGTGKLPWKVDWAAHWKVIGVTVEGAGKDHASAGGSYDIAMTICDEIYKLSKPYKLPYEFFLLGGRKMSSSKGLGLKAHDLTDVLPAKLARFLFLRTNYKEQIEFNPQGTMAIPDLFDEYDKCWKTYNSNKDLGLSRAFELAQIKELPERNPNLSIPRFRDIANHIQLPGPVSLENRFVGMEEILKERLVYAKYWLENFAPEEFKIIEASGLSGITLPALDKEEITYLSQVIDLINKTDDPEKLQSELYQKSKDLKIDSKKAFSAIYKVVIGKKFGPKAAWLLLNENKEEHLLKLREAVGKK